MRIFIVFLLLILLGFDVQAQMLSLDELIQLSNEKQSKLSRKLIKENLVPSERFINADTIFQNYLYGKKRRRAINDSDSRYLQEIRIGNKTMLNYATTSAEECAQVKDRLRDKGFHCDCENKAGPSLYQKNDILVTVTNEPEDTLTWYKFRVERDVLPPPGNIQFAEDFLQYDSHEKLKYVFGESNVRKDVFYLTESEAVQCSILMPNTDRQVIFIWKDQLNRCTISSILLGSTLRGKSSSQVNFAVLENRWNLKTGIRPNMSLNELVRNNDDDINFYGWNTPYPGMVARENKGKIDFTTTGIMLGCLNCNESRLANQSTISAEMAINEGMHLYVLTIMIYPQRAGIDSFKSHQN
jgi:hypothetical protein